MPCSFCNLPNHNITSCNDTSLIDIHYDRMKTIYLNIIRKVFPHNIENYAELGKSILKGNLEHFRISDSWATLSAPTTTRSTSGKESGKASEAFNAETSLLLSQLCHVCHKFDQVENLWGISVCAINRRPCKKVERV